LRWPPSDAGWPLAELSRQVMCRPHRWHVQETGEGPVALLIHGAGGATHSWAGVIPILAQSHRVVAIDLPGQGFTQSGARSRSGLGPMAEDLDLLLRAEGWKPELVVGHSAGAAIALQMALDGALSRARIVGLNAALGKFSGVAEWLFPVMAKVLAYTPFTADVFSATATRASVERLIAGTGSVLQPAQVDLYLQLVKDRAHVDATLAMMAQWDLGPLQAALPRVRHDVTLITTSKDGAVPPKVSREAAEVLPRGRHVAGPPLGHLAQEESPAAIAELILAPE
jgi:magnesium chelatase accessory protein